MASVWGGAGVHSDVVLDLHADVLFGFALSIPPAHSQGEDYSENGSSKA